MFEVPKRNQDIKLSPVISPKNIANSISDMLTKVSEGKFVAYRENWAERLDYVAANKDNDNQLYLYKVDGTKELWKPTEEDRDGHDWTCIAIEE